MVQARLQVNVLSCDAVEAGGERSLIRSVL